MNRFKVAYDVTNRAGKRKNTSRNVEADITKLDKQGLNALTDVLTVSHGLRQDENQANEIPNPAVEITAVRGLSKDVVGLEYPGKTPVVSVPAATPKQEHPVGQAAGKADTSKKARTEK